MTPTDTRDVYFWSGPTGLMAFPAAAFSANASRLETECGNASDPLRTVPGLIDAAPVASYATAVRPDARAFAKALGVTGLLWTAVPNSSAISPYPGDQIRDMIPAMMAGTRARVRDCGDGRVVWDVEVTWTAVGPFVAEGFSRPGTTQGA